MPTIHPDLYAELKPFLQKDEKLLWAGKPPARFILSENIVRLVLHMIVLFAFFAYWIRLTIETDLSFAVFGVVVFITIQFSKLRKYIADAKGRRNTTYGLTDNRAIIKFGGSLNKVETVNLRTISDITYLEKKDGLGTIRLGPTDDPHKWLFIFDEKPWVERSPQFFLIADAKHVFEQIIEIQNKWNKAEANDENISA